MRLLTHCLFILLLSFTAFSCKSTGQNTEEAQEPEKLKALIIDGQNNHDMWPKITVMMKQYLEETGLFTVDVERTAFTWKGDKYLQDFAIAGMSPTTSMEKPQPDPNYAPDFSAYDVVISNFGWNAAPWSETTKNALEDYISNGGGLVIVHAADNSFPEWKAFNLMIGLGGWGDRTEKDGPYVYYNGEGELVRDTTAGPGGGHGPQHEFQITLRNTDHPITKGMPEVWLHTKDELYERLRGPAENMEVLATTYADPEMKGSGRHEPMMMVISYGQGRIFHTPMGHADYSAECVGFITTITRGTEWAATGKVTRSEIPSDFPTAEASSSRAFTKAE